MNSKKSILSLVLSTFLVLFPLTNAFAITLIDQPIDYRMYNLEKVTLDVLRQDLTQEKDVLVKKSLSQEEIHVFDRATKNYLHTYLITNGNITKTRLAEFKEEYRVYKDAQLMDLPTIHESNVQNYDWYIDQGNTGAYSDGNCGPSSVAMALKWFNSNSQVTAQQARSDVRPNGEWWYTSDIVSYLSSQGASVSYKLSADEESLKAIIDNGNIAILCINSAALSYNSPPATSRVGRYYPDGTGHFIVLTGYLQTKDKTYFEVYDSNNFNRVNDNTDIPMGKGRYLESSDLLHAMKVWWNNAIEIQHPLTDNSRGAQDLVNEIQKLIETKDNRISPPQRLAGQNRFQTAKAISEQISSDSVQDIILVSGNNFPDALSASVFAKKLSAPILLVDSAPQSSQEAFDYIHEHLNPSGTIHIIGGEGVIGQDIGIQLQQRGFTHIERIEGIDRYDTNIQIAQKLEVAPNTPVVITSGENFSDTLSISSVASHKGYPILLVRRNGLSQEVKEFINKSQPSEVFIIGGDEAVPDLAEKQISSLLPEVRISRLSGSNRYDTAGKVIKAFSPHPQTLYLASGLSFPDALVGSTLASATGDPILLIDPNTSELSPEITDYLKQLRAAEIQPKLVSFGGTAVVPDSMVKKIQSYLFE